MAQNKFDWRKIPNPIIFGPKQPQIRLMLVGGVQKTYSQSNFNLYLDERSFSAIEERQSKDTFTISNFLHAAQGPEELPVRSEFRLPSCGLCNQNSPCKMMVESVDTYEEGGLKLAKINLRDKAEIDECPILKKLFDCMQSEEEKRFARVYYDWALNESDGFRELAKLWCEKQTKLRPYFRSPNRVTEIITQHFTAPALLPQVWLNYAYDPHVSPKEIERTVLKDMPARVDFLAIDFGQRDIFEIDGPSHYATFDRKSGRYEIDEELYARNLRIQRTLTSQGWHVHRFGNWEIMNEPDLLWNLCVLEWGIGGYLLNMEAWGVSKFLQAIGITG